MCYPHEMGLIHAYPDFFSFLDGTAEAHFHLVKIDVDDFLAVRADLCHLPVEIDRISATWAARNDDSDDLRLLLHD